jgi:hypothetical protein
VALVPQPHGGALLARGRSGNRGGSGRPRDAVRAAMRAKLDEVLSSLTELHAAGKLDPLKYAEFLAKYGMGTQIENENSDTGPVVVRIVRE